MQKPPRSKSSVSLGSQFREMRSLIFTLFIISIVSSCYAQPEKTQRTLLKQFVFCKCFEYANDDSLYFRRSDISAGVLRELAYYDEHVFVSADSVASLAAKKIIPSIIGDHNGRKTVLMECLDFFESRELERFVRQQDQYLIEGWRTVTLNKK